MDRRRIVLCGLSAGLFSTALLGPSSGQTPSASWPRRTVRFIVSLGPSSGADISARLFADRLTGRWKQPVLVENRPGGDGVVAITAFIGAHDDHTLLFTPTSSFIAHPYQLDRMPYDPRELSPIARVSNTVVVIAVPAALNVGSVGDFVALIRKDPGKLNYASAVGMTDVIFDGYFKSAGLSITRVPYRDVVSPLTDLGEGRIQAYVGSFAIVQPHLAAGRVRVIALTSSERPSFLAQVPTVAEQAYPQLTFDGLVGLFGPPTMPAGIRERIAADIKAVATDPVIVDRLTATAQVLSPGGPAEFAASIETQRAKLDAIAKQLGLKPAQ
jgi:tripartite-type tricarboxylate transporter receptor subunit TctC